MHLRYSSEFNVVIIIKNKCVNCHIKFLVWRIVFIYDIVKNKFVKMFPNNENLLRRETENIIRMQN